jgi:hypothetical protein
MHEAAAEEAFDTVAGFGQHAPVRGVARRLE